MPWTIARLRLAIMAVAIVLLLAIVGSFLYGRWRLRHIAQDLPERLGIQIQQSAQGFVLSKTEKGRPLFTLHAARAVKFKSDGHVALHDVEIDLYSRDTGKADSIAGADFNFDPRSEVVESAGEARIILHAPPNNSHGIAAGNRADELIQVTTHGLTFNQKTGTATCTGDVDFQTGDTEGHALGAEYDSKLGHLLLKSAIVFRTQVQGQPAQLNASRAIYDRNENQLHLWQIRYVSIRGKGTAGTATIHMRGNRSAEQVDAKDGVEITSGNRMKVKAPAAHVLLSESNQPKEAHLFGGVELQDNQPTQKLFGSAQESEMDFDGLGRPTRIASDGRVKLNQQTDAGTTRRMRSLTSDHLTLHLLSAKAGGPQLRSGLATGNAIFSSRSTVPGRVPQEMTMAGETLTADFAAKNRLQQISGAGKTRLQMVAANGDVDTSTGDTLQMEFTNGQTLQSTVHAVSARTVPGSMTGQGGTGSLTAQSIRTAVQTGHVVLQQTRKMQSGRSSGARVSTATASRASYVSADDTLTLTGQPVYRDEQLQLTAQSMQVERATGKMIAMGSVQATVQAANPAVASPGKGSDGLMGGSQPAHIIAEQAVLIHDTQSAIFSGRARLWQGADTVEAPVIEISRKTQTLMAHGGPACTLCVITNFPSAIPGSANAGNGDRGVPSNFRVLSDELLYSGAEKKAKFLHHVQVTSSSGILTGSDAEVTLTSSRRREGGKAGSAKEGNGSSDRNSAAPDRSNAAPASVERIVTTGNVRLLQPGRRATGTQLIYTVADGHFVLTGDATNIPTVTDVDHGTVTGEVLTFASREQAIMVSGRPGQRTTTITRVQKK